MGTLLLIENQVQLDNVKRLEEFERKKMSGHMGNVRQTTQNLKVQKIDLENNFILIKGAVPGPVDQKLL